VATGSATISAASGAISGSTNLTVTAPVLVSIAVTPANPSITKSATQQFTATGTYSDSSTQNLTSSVTWSSTNTAVATITSGGLATGVATGSTTISAASGSTLLRSYQTNFPAMEDPISESNNWVNGAATGLDWGNVQTTPGVAFGTVVSGGPPYNDSNASLTGTWRSDQSACGTVFMSGSLNRAGVPYEIEIELRHTIAAHNIIGYEFNYSMYNNGNQYMQIVRWNGSLNNFTILGGGSGTPPSVARSSLG